MKECQRCNTCYADDVDVCPKDNFPTIHTIPGEPILEGKFDLESRIGQGGMGVVYKARHKYLKTQHAIKVILPDLVGNDPKLVTRFRQEALAAAAIKHRNVVQVTDYGVVYDSIPFLVMEYVEGEDLHDLLERKKRLTPKEAFDLIAQICKGMGAAHARGIVHRDLKPLNIMLSKPDAGSPVEVKILDFGLAKIKSSDVLGSFIQAQTTGIMGSPYYMAPELWSDDEPDSRSDIYSIGVILFQMLTGEVPFKGSSIPSIMKKHLTDSPATFAELGVELSPEIEGVVNRTLEKKRENRTPTAEILLEEYRAALASEAHVKKDESYASTLISSIRVVTNPVDAAVFLDGVPVDKSNSNGTRLLEEIEKGAHNLRVICDGYETWEERIEVTRDSQKFTVDLKPVSAFADDPGKTLVIADGVETSAELIIENTPTNMSITHNAELDSQTTLVRGMETGEHSSPNLTVGQESGRSPVFIALVVGLGLAFLASVGGVGLYWGGMFDTPDTIDSLPNAEATAGIANDVDKVDGAQSKAEMVQIPGGEFRMGRNSGLPREKPEHRVSVAGFWMDKTEVTNEEYSQFIKDSKSAQPPHFSNGRPLAGSEKQAVSYVSIEDVEKFAAWRSERDGVQYRLPTEEEWEYAARSGAKNWLFPWGENFEKGKALIGRKVSIGNVGENGNGANVWGVQDLIGNVWEWTSSRGMAYPGSEVEVSADAQVSRGGGFFDKVSGKDAITSTFRGLVSPNTKDKALGFRLVREHD